MPPWSRTLVALLPLAAAGCAASSASPRPTSAALRLTQHVGGTCHRTQVYDGLWYVICGWSLLVMDAESGQTVLELALAEPGSSGPAVDMARLGERLLVVLDREAVLEIDLSHPRRPVVASRRDQQALGIAPRRLSVTDDAVYVSGVGGVVRWLDGAVLLEGSQEYGAVAWTGAELVVCSGRRIYRLADGEYAGSASALVPLPETLGGPGLLVFTRRGFASTSVGLMSGELREVDALAATVTAEGEVHSIRIFGRRVWIVGDRRISSYAVSAGALVEPVHLDYAGAFDVDWVDPDHLVVAGCTGCAIIRWRDGRVLPEPRVVFERRGPGCLQGARSDGRFVLAGGPLGTWMYEIGRKARPVPRVTDAFPAPATEVVTVAGRVSVGRDGRTVTVSAAGGDRSYAEPGGAAVHCLAAAGGAVWIGHDLGVTVLPLTADPGAGEIARIRLDGPVLYLFPRLAGGGVVFVSQNGGMGVISLSADG